MLCSPSDLPAKGFSNQIPLVTRGNCTFYEKVRLAQGSGARGLLIVSKETLVWPPGCPSWVVGTLGDSWPAGQQDLPGARVGDGEDPMGLGAGGDEFALLTMAVDSGLWTLVLEGACHRAFLGLRGYRALGKSSGGTI